MDNGDCLVSIITPMYQAEKFIQRYIDMVLAFDYRKFELILINDGSTDRTDEIVNANRERLEKAGIELKYLKFETNFGQAYAVNEALKLITGKYMLWCDVDDIYLPHCISKLMEALRNNPDCKIAFSNCVVVKYDDLENPVKIPKHQVEHKDILADCIFDRKMMNSPLRGFVETEALFSVLKNKSIYVSRLGQNFQIIMPIVARYKWAYVEEVCSKYVLYPSSHSHTWNLRKANRDLLNLFIHIFDDMDIPESKKRYYKFLAYYKFVMRELNNLLRININFKRKFIRIVLFSKEIINTEWNK
ncbi:MAG: glycosyltransferase family 2 protein [Lentisphaeria bacterium]|nr:glycosyltransferase family 2 protein [Lentisphaeria bacterium]